MKTAVVVLDRFRSEGERVAEFLDAELVPYSDHVFADLYRRVEVIVAVMSAGIAVRGCAPHLSDKWHDPALVVVTPDLRYAIPVLGGHHGGNVCAKRLAALGIEPVISTATETRGRPSVEETARTGGFVVVNRSSTRVVNESRYVIGVGCRLGTTAEEIVAAVNAACSAAGISHEVVKMYATTIKKFHEKGLHEAVRSLSGNLIFLDDETINAQVPRTPSRAGMLGLAGVAEPCALALAKSGTLILNKTVYGRVTIAIGK